MEYGHGRASTCNTNQLCENLAKQMVTVQEVTRQKLFDPKLSRLSCFAFCLKHFVISCQNLNQGLVTRRRLQCTHTNTQTNTHKHKHKHTHTQTHMPARMHTRTHTHTHIHTQTQTHTHTHTYKDTSKHT